MKIPYEVKSLFERTSLVAFATADDKGFPNVVPIFWKKITVDDRILIIDNFMDMTKRNIQENRQVCITFWDSSTEEAYKIKGHATYHTTGQVYEEGKVFIQSKKPERVPKGVVEVKITEIFTVKPGPDAGKRLIS